VSQTTFLQELRQLATLNAGSIFGFVFKDARGNVDAAVHFRIMDGFDYINSTYLTDLTCDNPQKGYGTKAMELVCKVADAHGVTLSLHPMAYGDNLTPLDALVRFYTSFGFRDEGEAGYFRKPRKNQWRRAA
jgi:hypothetical protein